MGADKARLVLMGVPLLERATQALGEVVPRVLLASGDGPRYPETGLECLLDEHPGAGPLGGLAAALARLADAGTSYACVLACDMPRVSGAVFRALLAHARAEDADACLVRTAAGTEPLCGVYHTRILPLVRAALARGERRMNAFHGTIRLASVSEETLLVGCARNLNTPEELQQETGGLG